MQVPVLFVHHEEQGDAFLDFWRDVRVWTKTGRERHPLAFLVTHLHRECVGIGLLKHVDVFERHSFCSLEAVEDCPRYDPARERGANRRDQGQSVYDGDGQVACTRHAH